LTFALLAPIVGQREAALWNCQVCSNRYPSQ
jgi:hypothetical protein